MSLMLTRSHLMERHSGIGHSARGLLRGADSLLRKESRLQRSGEIVLSGFVFGMLQGKFKDQGGLVAKGLPVDLLAGAVFHILGIVPFFRSYAHHFSALGDGALASFFTTAGYRVGERWAKGGSLTSGIAGMFGDSASAPVSGGASISDRELANLVRE